MVLYAKAMLAFFVALGVFSLVAIVRSFYRPLDPTPEKLASVKKGLALNSWVLIAAAAVAINAIASKQYYLLGAAALLFTFVLPVIVHYIRLKNALRTHPGYFCTERAILGCGREPRRAMPFGSLLTLLRSTLRDRL